MPKAGKISQYLCYYFLNQLHNGNIILDFIPTIANASGNLDNWMRFQIIGSNYKRIEPKYKAMGYTWV